MRELKNTEMVMVAGGISTGGLGIRELIEQAYPGGEWVGRRYYPNGVPSAPPLGDISTGF